MDPKNLGTVNSDLMTGRYGGAGASAAWQMVLDLYYDDRMREAFEHALSLGAGDGAFGTHTYRMVEAEWRAREYGEIRKLSDGVSVEAPRELDSAGWEWLLEAIENEFETVCQRLGYTPLEKVLVSLMVQESDAPWTPYRHGFCVDKVPYDKVVLPFGLMRNEGHFRNGLRHEFGHVVNLNLAQGRMGMWLEEAIAMRMGGDVDGRYVEELKKGAPIWMGPNELSTAFVGDRRGATGEKLWHAYEQAGMIGKFLGELKGDAALGELARGMANNSTWKEIAMRVTGQSDEDEALREVFGMGEDEVFLKSFEAATA